MRKHPSEVFLFFLFTTDAASESNANIVCKLPSGEEENERSEVKKNSTLKPNERGIKTVRIKTVILEE